MCFYSFIKQKTANLWRFLLTNRRAGAEFLLPGQRDFLLDAAAPRDEQFWRHGERLRGFCAAAQEKAWQSLDREQPGNSSSCEAPATCCSPVAVSETFTVRTGDAR